MDTYDILLKNLKIIDGTGAPAFVGDIGIKNDRIADVGQIYGKAKVELQCNGLIASPGFIDMHNHSDFSVLQEPYAKNYISQGVTTLLLGNCGISGAPISNKNRSVIKVLKDIDNMDLQWESFGEYIEVLEESKKSINLAALIGQGNVRGAVLGLEKVKAAPEDLDKMRQIVREAMESGAFGLSTGLIYDPGLFTDTEELIALTEVVGAYHGVYATHLRNEGDLLVDAVLEAIRIGQKTGARVHISHHKASGRKNWGLVNTTLELMNYYRRLGVEVTFDLYPCIFSATDLYSFFPSWIREKGKKTFSKLIKEEDVQERLRNELSRPGDDWENVIFDIGFDEIIINSSNVLQQYIGKSINDIAQEFNNDPYEALFHILGIDPNIAVLAGGIHEEDVKTLLKHKLAMVASDGSIVNFGEGMPHPRNYRAFTRVLTKYVKEEEIISLEEAINKMSYLPAWKLGLQDRGLIKSGFKADINVFDFWNLKCESDFSSPHGYSKGMEYVLVNGEFVIYEKEFTKALPGEVLKKQFIK